MNHWSWLGCFDDPQAAQTGSKARRDTVFDRDAYRMLMSALRKGKVELLDAESLAEMDNPILAAAFD